VSDEKNLIGQSFDNAALTGSGTILPDGTYGPNLPDPTEVRGLGPDKTSGGRDLALTHGLIPDELIVDKERSTAAKPDESETKPSTSRATAAKPR
jgi:hypothetical protein